MAPGYLSKFTALIRQYVSSTAIQPHCPNETAVEKTLQSERISWMS